MDLHRMERIGEQKRSPIRWFGGKGTFIRQLAIAMPDDVDRYIDGFCGACAFPLYLLQAGKLAPSQIILNDANQGLIDFWKRVSSANRGAFISELLDIQNEHGAGTEELFEACERTNDVDGTSFYCHNVLSHGGSQTCGSLSDPEKSGHGLKRNEIRKLGSFGELLEGVRFTCADYKKGRALSKKSVRFLDAPYGRVGSGKGDKENYKMREPFNQPDFADYCNSVKDDSYVMVTHDDRSEIIDLFSGWQVYRMPKSGAGVATDMKTELLITNYQISKRSMMFLQEDFGVEKIGCV